MFDMFIKKTEHSTLSICYDYYVGRQLGLWIWKSLGFCATRCCSLQKLSQSYICMVRLLLYFKVLALLPNYVKPIDISAWPCLITFLVSVKFAVCFGISIIMKNCSWWAHLCRKTGSRLSGLGVGLGYDNLGCWFSQVFSCWWSLGFNSFNFWKY